jgi:transposase
LEAKEEVYMSNRRFTEEYKAEAIKQITERGYKVQEVSRRLGVSSKSLYAWLKSARGNIGRHGKDTTDELRQENLRLKAELKRVEEERDILKKAAAYFAKASR